MSYTKLSVDVDEADVTILEDSLSRLNSNAETIVSELGKVSLRSESTTKHLSPLVQRTRSLNTVNSNVLKAQAILNSVLKFTQDASQVESFIVDPKNITETGPKQFITKLISCSSLLQRAEKQNLGQFRGVTNSLKASLSQGESHLKSHFNSVLSKESQDFDPQPLMDSGKPFPFLGAELVGHLTYIMSYFASRKMPIDNILIDQRSKLLTNSLAYVEQLTKPSKETSKYPYQKGSNGIGNYGEAFYCFMVNEHSLLQDFYPDEPHKQELFFEKLLETPMLNFNRVIRYLLEFVEIHTDNLGLLAFEMLLATRKVLDAAKKFTGQIPQTTEAHSHKIQKLCRQILESLLVYIDQRVSTLAVMPTDSGLCDLTIEVLSKLRRFSEYKESLLLAVEGWKPGAWIAQPPPRWVDVFSSVIKGSVEESSTKVLLSSYFNDCIDALVVTLQLRAETLVKDRNRIGLFLLNNFVIVDQYVERSVLKDILGNVGHERLQKLRKRCNNMFMEDWNNCAAYLMDTTVIQSHSSTKEKDSIKEALKKFNSQFENLVERHKAYKLKDPQMRQYLCDEIKVIRPLYKRFYDRHTKGEYAKSVNKNVRWTPREFDALLDALA